MSSRKCERCGMVNLAAALACKGCGAPLAATVETNRPVNTQAQRLPPFINFVTSRHGAILCLLLFIGLGIYNWHALITRRHYYPKMAFLAPLGIITFLVLTISPGLINRPRDKNYKVQIWILLTAGLVLGALNSYLMGWVY